MSGICFESGPPPRLCRGISLSALSSLMRTRPFPASVPGLASCARPSPQCSATTPEGPGMGDAALETISRPVGVLSVYTADPPGIGACAPYLAAGGPARMAPVERGGPRPQSTTRPAGTVRAHIPAWTCGKEGVGTERWEKLKRWKLGTDQAASWRGTVPVIGPIHKSTSLKARGRTPSPFQPLLQPRHLPGQGDPRAPCPSPH